MQTMEKILGNNNDLIIDDYEFGLSKGKEIVEKMMPSLSIDEYKTNLVVIVSKKDTKKINKIERDYSQTIEDWEKWAKLKYKLRKKYLPETIEFEIKNVKFWDIKSFKLGVIDYIFDSNITSYNLDYDSVKLDYNSLNKTATFKFSLLKYKILI